MGSLSDVLENEVLDHILKVGAYTPPATVYLGFSTADPLDTAAGWADPTYTGYARKAISFGAAASRRITQDADVTFDPCTAGSSTVSHWGLWSAVSAGVMMAHGAFAVAKSIVPGNTPKVVSGEVYVEFSAVANKGVYSAYALLLLNWLFDAGTLAQPTNIDLALHTAVCADAGPGTEVTGGSYVRKTCNTWDTAVGGVSENTGAQDFATATASWGTVVAMSAYDDTEPMLFTNDPTDQLVGIGDICRVEDGGFDVTLS
jgi:hypothetical protein